MTSKSVFLVRHGTPDWNQRHIRYDVPPGPALTDKGYAEARMAGEYLQYLGITRLYTSPMERAAQTATKVGTVLGLEALTEKRITEWTRDEQKPHVTARMMDFWREQIEGRADGPVVLVTHAGTILALINHLDPEFDLTPYTSRFDHRNCAPPAGIWRATQEAPDAPWQWSLVFIPETVGQLS